MDYIRNNICWDEQGTFVFEVLTDTVFVRTRPGLDDKYKTDICFRKGELVSIDLVRPSRVPSADGGPFLRLSDGCGWLLEQHDTKVALTRRPVETGLWTFFIDNFPLGQALVRHPVVHRLDLIVSPQATYPPMRKIYCDRRVVSSSKVEFFRVQGTKGWIVGRGSTSSKKKKATSMLMPEPQVKTGLFAYQCLIDTAVHIRPSRKESFVTPLTIQANEVVIANLVRESSDGHKFVRLSDGAGWIPLSNKAGETCLCTIPIVDGSWKFQSESSSPLHLLRQPMDRKDMFCESKTTYKICSEIDCDQMIAGPDGVVFYRVRGTEGYVPDRRGGVLLLELLRNKDADQAVEGGWTPDFVRGIASLVHGIHESGHDEHAKILSFTTSPSDDNKPPPVVEVHCATRTIGCGDKIRRDCDPTDVAEILRDPSELKEQPRVLVFDCNNLERAVGDEEEAFLRRKLVECYIKSEKLKKQQLKILTVLKQCDDKRGEAERTLAQRAGKRAEEFKNLELERKKEEEIRRSCTCEDCGAVFKDFRSKQKHWRSVHGHKCANCGGTFATFYHLVEHQDEAGYGCSMDSSTSSRHEAYLRDSTSVASKRVSFLNDSASTLPTSSMSSFDASF